MAIRVIPVIMAVMAFSTDSRRLTDASVVVKPDPSHPYSQWPSNVITYRLGAEYTDAETRTLKSAMQQITEDTGNCIRFVQGSTTKEATNASFALVKKESGTTFERQMCWSAPGYNTKQNDTAEGQTVVMFGGNTDGSCLGSGKEREAMRVLVNLLGLLNEFQREDRESGATPPMIFAKIDDQDRNKLVKDGLVHENLFGKASMLNSSVAQSASEFDSLSITMVRPDQFAKTPQKHIFVVQPKVLIGNKAALSVNDCLALMSMYGKYCPIEGSGPRPMCSINNPYAVPKTEEEPIKLAPEMFDANGNPV